MKKTIFSLVATTLFSFGAFAQLEGFPVKNEKDYFIGAVFSKNQLVNQLEGKPLESYPNQLVVTLTTTTNDELIGMPMRASAEEMKRITDIVYVELTKAEQFESFKSSSITQTSNDNAFLDQFLQTKDAAVKIFNNPNIAKENKLYSAYMERHWSTLHADYFTFSAAEQTKYNAADEPLAISSLTFGRSIKMIVASPKDFTLIKEAFTIFKNKDKNNYKRANAILADATIYLFVNGNKAINTVGQSPQQIYDTYTDYIEKPIERTDLNSPLIFSTYKVFAD